MTKKIYLMPHIETVPLRSANVICSSPTPPSYTGEPIEIGGTADPSGGR